MNAQIIRDQASINDNLVEQLKIENSTFKISITQGMEEAIEWYIENIGKKHIAKKETR